MRPLCQHAFMFDPKCKEQGHQNWDKDLRAEILIVIFQLFTVTVPTKLFFKIVLFLLIYNTLL